MNKSIPQFKRTCPGLTKREIKEIEKLLAISLPDEFREFYCATNGGKPLKRKVSWNSRVQTDVSHILPLRKAMDFPLSVVDVVDTIKSWFDVTKLLPFALDSGGNFFCVCLVGDEVGEIFFASNDGNASSASSTRPIARDLKSFLNSLT
jgi:cell wall assembly regulator SMI1